MGPPTSGDWRKLPVSLTELCINTTLRCGQSFRWRKSAQDEWSCALHGRLLTLRQDSNDLHYRAIDPQTARKPKSSKRAPPILPTPPSSSPASSVAGDSPHPEDTLDLIKHYLNLTPNLTALYAQWSAKDPNFRKRVQANMQNLQGIRILKQDPWEALCGFICSSNNNIKRIMLMMNRLCTHYGRFIGELEEDVIDLDAEPDTESNIENIPPESPDKKLRKPKMKTIKVAYHDFPPPSALTGPDVEATLRQLGFGYRAKYIYQTACIVANGKGGVQWLESLVNPAALNPATSHTEASDIPLPPEGRPGYRAAHAALLELTGVGPKVADCVCLFGLGWGEALPVDTHVWQIAVRDYKFGGKGGKNATMTKALYDAVGEKFRALWGVEAGWAHSVLFTADLRDFKEKVVKVEVKEPVLVKEEEDISEAFATSTDKPRKTRTSAPPVIVEKKIKREWEDEESTILGVHGQEDMISRVKRRRSGRT